MRKIITIGVLAGAAALTGLAGAAYAADGGVGPTTTAATSTEPHAKEAKAGGAITCVALKPGGKMKGDFKGGTVRAFPGTPPKGAQTVVVSPDGKQVQAFAKAVGPGTIKLDPSKIKRLPALPKGMAAHCIQVPAGSTPLDLTAVPGLRALPSK
jgi:hypothetical protein